MPIITVLMLALCYLYLAKNRAQEQEYKSFAFSQMIIEGMETERRRISRELHDIILPQVHDLAVSDQIRTICRDLMPPDFNQLSLKDSLAGACDTLARQSGIECACSIEDELSFVELHAENQLHLYRMIQESFNNIKKHSQAGKAALVVRSGRQGSTDTILICISDDGVGLKNKPGLQAITEGLGFNNMRQRAAILGAQLDFISEIGNGLMVRIEVPIAKEK